MPVKKEDDIGLKQMFKTLKVYLSDISLFLRKPDFVFVAQSPFYLHPEFQAYILL